ncbi:MAG: translation initiation factor IF-2 [Thermofilaceae archaeon]|nr:translation initiation factor IF-2 [Thermofilaceae archaeon]MCX8180186.1 translation initiation factor IF-2 [Thermofilaceae archaeon]MDW8004158.1 translation initiation factor IF-2 [Thermofilaceae archaeon]
MEGYVRSPILVVLGHVDVGKTTLLDKIRGTAVAKREPGTMTQHIGASFLPWKALEEMCAPLTKAVKVAVEIPGFLVIDTPGHEAFSNLRSRGGSIADLAILVVDVNRGFEKQTYEALELLKSRRTPFVVAANKVDRIPGWESHPGEPFVYSFSRQSPDVQGKLEELLVPIIVELNKEGFSADRYDRVRDFTRTVAIVPLSAVTGEGISDLMLVIAGLSQKYLAKRLIVKEGPARGVVLEVREMSGLGTTVAAIIYDGLLRKGDTIVVGGIEKPVVTKVKALLMPKPLDEMRSPEDKFLTTDVVKAAAGVLVAAHGLDNIVVGAPLLSVTSENDIENVVREVEEEVKAVRISRDVAGVVVKADTLGTLEALVGYLRRNGVPVRYADVGHVVKRDVVEASLVKTIDRFRAVILAFNVKVTEEAEVEAKASNISIFQGNIIYQLVEDYVKWYESEKNADRKMELSKLILPGKVVLLPGYVFRRSDPAIVGVKVVLGRLRKGYPLMTSDGKRVGEIMQIQEHKKPLEEAVKDQEVAISIRGKVIIGRHVKEDDALFVDVPLEHIDRLLEKYVDTLSDEEVSLLKGIRALKLGLISNLPE